ncbi:hypothetical protein OLE80_08705, partial [Streptococcus pneumoniae]|nr:hypothetical protein [Streptococcus pneumoniae]
MNKRQELIDELIKANEDGTYKTYKSTEEIKAMNNEEIQIIYSNMKNYLSDKRTHINYIPQLFTPNLKTIQNPCLSLDPGWFL